MILGIDEVGRGPWAGPLVMGAVVLGGATIDGLTDSKKLSKKRREELDVIIREQAIGYGLGWVSAKEIDTIGLSEALALACQRAVEAVDTLGVAYHEIVIDGMVNFLKDTPKGTYVTTMKKADLLVPSVSAASIIAKVARDNYMAEQDAIYDNYKFATHVGYGTAAHSAAIEKNGVTPLHRLSFAPLAKYRSSSPQPSEITVAKSKPSNYMGAIAEDMAADYLTRQGHEIADRNWKTKYCEIDIVSRKDGTVYFTEVKYRKQPNQGGGLAAITPKKLEQMKFAAAVYAKTKGLSDTDMLLAGASLTGQPPEVEGWLIIS
jgi:ribonuclease HII